MANRRVVPGFLGDAYRRRQGDFAPNLVGNQFTDGTTLFTLGNFAITSNLSTRGLSKVYNTGTFSDPICLENLELTESDSFVLESNSINALLNLDPSNIFRFVYYGSFTEFIRVNLEEIIEKWLGSLYVLKESRTTTQIYNTVLSYSYNSLKNTSTFLIPIQAVVNNFGLITDENVTENSTSNLVTSFTKYQISNDFGDFPLVGYTGNTTGYDYVSVEVEGNSFPTLTSGATFGQFNYHLRPNEDTLELEFFNQLTDFQDIMMSRLSNPKYTMSLKVPQRFESGIISVTQTFTWPTTDGYNIDIDTPEYGQYVTNLYRAALNLDSNKTDLVARKYIAESISEYDTIGGGDESTGRKVNKLLRIYGREFDEVKRYIDGISLTNRVTYNKKDNLPDELIKIMAKTLGFDVLQSLFDDKLFGYLLPETGYITFSGYSRNLSTKEIDTELWRRLVINAWWLYKSKGHRKVIEFFLNLFDIPRCVVDLDEYVYVAANKLDVEETFKEIENILGDQVGEIEDGGVVPAFDNVGLVNREDYPMDEYGFPKTLPNTVDYYFQLNGFWYNGGTLRKEGNNPHFGPYDYGSAYFDKFRCMVDGFVGSETGTTTFTTLINYFDDYNQGSVDDGLIEYGETYAETMTQQNRVSPNTNLISAGSTDIISRGGNNSFRITFSVGTSNCELTCPTNLVYYSNGVILDNDATSDDLNTVPLELVDPIELLAAASISPECCEQYGGYYGPLPPTNTSTDIKCPDQLQLQITLDGKVLGIENTECCTEQVVGQPVEWDGKGCILKQSPTTETPPTTTEVVSAQKMFSIGSPQPDFVCYWCPPLETQEFGNVIILVKPDGSLMSDEKCCILRGGTMAQVSGSKELFCVKGDVLLGPKCPSEFRNKIITDRDGQEYTVAIDGNGNSLTEECCGVYNTTFNSNFIYENGDCKLPNCPVLMEEREIDLPTDSVDGIGLEVRDVTDPNNPIPLTEVCCQKYAQDTGKPWYYDSVRGRCVNNNNTITETPTANVTTK